MQGATSSRTRISAVWRGQKHGRLSALPNRRWRTGKDALTQLKCVNHYGGGLYIMPRYSAPRCLCCRRGVRITLIMYLSVSERLEVRLTLLLCVPFFYASLSLVLSASLSLVLSSSLLSLVLLFFRLSLVLLFCCLSFSSSS